jgi:hypothetical protein
VVNLTVVVVFVAVMMEIVLVVYVAVAHPVWNVLLILSAPATKMNLTARLLPTLVLSV